MNKISSILQTVVIFALAPAALAGTLVPLTPDVANSSVPAFGSNVNSPLMDPFAYDCDDPIAVLPQQIYNPGAAGFHGNEADGVPVLASYTFDAPVMMSDSESFVIDLYGRDGANDCCAERDDDLDIELFSGGVGGTVVASFTQQIIPNAAPYHLRLTHRGTDAFDAIRITARDTDNPAGSYFTLMEIRAAVLIDPTDTDEDGLPDAWEMEHNLDHLDDGTTDPVNGPMGDPDDDGLDNLGEFQNGTDPRDADSDDDMLNDGPEVAGAGARPPTDPNNPDTDFDTLTDFVETNTGIFAGASDTGSNPRSADTDMDGAADPDEVRRGTDPSDAMSGNNLALNKTIGFFDAAGLATGFWGGFTPSMMVDGNLTTISHPLNQAAADYYVELDLGEEINVGFIDLTGRAFRDACCTDRLQDVTLVILDSFRNETHRETVAGIVDFTREIDLTATQPRGQFVQIINASGADYGPQIGEIAVYGSAAPLTPFVITGFEFDRTTGDASLTFNSVPGATYSIFGSNSMQEELWSELDDGVDSQGEATTYEFNDLELIGQSRRFYQVRRN